MKEATKNVWRFVLPWMSGILVLLLIQWIGDLFIGNEIVEQPLYYCAVIWCLFAALSARFEAFYWVLKVSSKIEILFNEHVLLTAIRATIMIPILLLTNWKAMLCYICMFPFIHDGSYYAGRDRLQRGTYRKGWFDQSKTSTALSTRFFTPVVRTVLFIVAVFILIMLRYGYF